MTDRRPYVHLTAPQLRARLNDLSRQLDCVWEQYGNMLFAREQLIEELTRRVEG